MSDELSGGVQGEGSRAITATGSTSLVSKGSSPSLLGFALEHGGLTQTTSGNTITFRGNVMNSITIALYDEDDPEDFDCDNYSAMFFDASVVELWKQKGVFRIFPELDGAHTPTGLCSTTGTASTPLSSIRH